MTFGYNFFPNLILVIAKIYPNLVFVIVFYAKITNTLLLATSLVSSFLFSYQKKRQLQFFTCYIALGDDMTNQHELMHYKYSCICTFHIWEWSFNTGTSI